MGRKTVATGLLQMCRDLADMALAIVEAAFGLAKTLIGLAVIAAISIALSMLIPWYFVVAFLILALVGYVSDKAQSASWR